MTANCDGSVAILTDWWMAKAPAARPRKSALLYLDRAANIGLDQPYRETV